MQIREVPLTNGYVAIVDADDYERVMKVKWCAAHDRSGSIRAKRRPTKTEPESLLHRFILNVAPGTIVDHINGNTLDNRKVNLRVCTKKENSWNRRGRSNNDSGFKGVTYTPACFRARIMVDNKEVFLGRFDTAEEAALAYDQAARKYFGSFAKLNFPGMAK